MEVIPQEQGISRRATVNDRSRDADLVILGFRGETVRRARTQPFTGYDGVGNILFVNTKKEIDIVSPDAATLPVADASPPPAQSDSKPVDGA